MVLFLTNHLSKYNKFLLLLSCYCYCSQCLYLHLFPVCIASLLFSYSANSRKCVIKLSVSVRCTAWWPLRYAAFSHG